MSHLTSHAERGRAGGHATAARYDPLEYTAKARAVFIESFLQKVDPTGELRRTNPTEARRRAESARSLWYAQMAYKSLRARRLKARAAGKKDE
jgi:hypothetical protein